MSKETYTFQKNQHVENDLQMSKETYIHENRPIKEIHTHIHSCTRTSVHIARPGGDKQTIEDTFVVQSGKDPQDVLSCRSISAKEPLIIGSFAENDLYRLSRTHF